MAKELGQTVHLQFFNDLSTFNIDQKFDVISAIDFDDLFGRHNGYTAVCEAYTHLKEGGRLYLSYDTKNFIYDNAGCIVSNMKDEALQLHPSSESTPQVRYIPFTTRLSDTARKWAPMLGTSRTPSRLSFWRNDVDEEQDLFDRGHHVLSGSAPTAF